MVTREDKQDHMIELRLLVKNTQSCLTKNHILKTLDVSKILRVLLAHTQSCVTENHILKTLDVCKILRVLLVHCIILFFFVSM